MLVGQQDLGHLLGTVAHLLEGGREVVVLLAHVEGSAQLLGRLLVVVLEASVHQNHLVAHVDEEALQAATVDDLLIKLVFPFFSAEGERLVHKSAINHFNSFNFHFFYYY